MLKELLELLFVAAAIVTLVAPLFKVARSIRKHRIERRQQKDAAENEELDRLADIHEALERYATYQMRPIGGDDGRGFFLKSADDTRRRELNALVAHIDALAEKSRRAEVRAVLREWAVTASRKAWNGVKDERGAYELQNRIKAVLREARPG